MAGAGDNYVGLQIINMKYSIIYLFIISTFLFGCNRIEDNTQISKFIGPQPGYKVTLESSDGTEMEIIGLDKIKNGITIKEVIIFPDNMQKPSDIPKAIDSYYSIKRVGDKLIKEAGDSEVITSNSPIILGKSKWTMIGIQQSFDTTDSKPKKTKYKCVIYAKESLIIAGEERMVVTSECKRKDLEYIDTWRFVYAEQIGLIEMISTYSLPDSANPKELGFTFVSYGKVDDIN